MYSLFFSLFFVFVSTLFYVRTSFRKLLFPLPLPNEQNQLSSSSSSSLLQTKASSPICLPFPQKSPPSPPLRPLLRKFPLHIFPQPFSAHTHTRTCMHVLLLPFLLPRGKTKENLQKRKKPTLQQGVKFKLNFWIQCNQIKPLSNYI